MGMIMAVLGGFLAIILGIIGLIFWFKYFLYLLAGSIPIILLTGGLIALFIGITEIKDTIKSKEEEEASRFDTFRPEPRSAESPNQKKEDQNKDD
ncbi:MAG: hypothetical protein K6U11_10170 [bacterium]|nr:hypothetical protein [bacterium]